MLGGRVGGRVIGDGSCIFLGEWSVGKGGTYICLVNEVGGE